MGRTSGAGVPSALAVGGCSAAGSALIWTTNTGPGCNTAIDAATVAGNTLPSLSAGTVGGLLYWDSTSGGGNLNRSAAITLHALIIGGGTGAPTPLASLGTSTTLLHGAAAGDPTFSAVVDGDLSLTTPALGTPSALVGTNISGTGSSFTAGHVTTNANLTGDVTSSGNATTIAANAVTSAKMAVVNTRRVCDIIIGDTTGSAITNGQLGPQKRLCFVPAAATVVEIDVSADAGTPNVIVQNIHGASTTADYLSGALATAASGGIACSNTGGTTGIDGATTCTNTLQNTSIAAGDYIQLKSGTAGGTAKLMSIHVIYTVN